MDDTQQSGQGTEKKAGVVKVVMGWVGGATAIIGLIASLSGGFHWFTNQRAQRTELKTQMAVAESQAKQGEYRASVRTYGDILKSNPLDAQALDGQLNAAMLWVENFQVLGRDGSNAADAAAPQLDEIMPVLDAGLARSKGPRAADVQAHLGWAHWLNWHIAEREFGPAAEQNLRAAIETDKSNVYGNAMLGNWMLQNHGSFQEAVGHLKTAVDTGKARPLVRKMQLGGLLYDETRGARAELVKAVNDMRKDSEALDEGEKHRILGFCYGLDASNRMNFVESLSAVAEDDAWKTYLWLDDAQGDDPTDKSQALTREFVYANLLEVSGKRAEALEKYRALQLELKGSDLAVKSQVDEAVKKLSSG